MNEKHTGSQLSKDVRPAKDLTPPKPIPPSFRNREEWDGFQAQIMNALDSGLLPKSIENAKQAIVIAQKGREMGFEPLYALSVIYLVNGKPALEGEAMLGLVKKRYPDAHVRWVEMSHAKAVLELGKTKEDCSTFTFTIQDAQRAGLVIKINPDGTVVAAPGKKPWEQYTRKMLCWRAVSEGVTLLFPECIQGCLTPDELTPPDNYSPVKQVSARDLDDQFRPEVQAIEPVKEVVTDAEVIDVDKKKTDGTYLIKFGFHIGKRLNEIEKPTLKLYLAQLKKQDPQQKDLQIQELIAEISNYL